MEIVTRLGEVLEPWQAARRWYVAWSGGLDSTVLLHAVHMLCPRPPLFALHVDHGLQAASPGWVRHCEALSRQWEVPLLVRRVTVAAGASQEAAARAARYAAFSAELQEGDLLLTAQHRGDQAETLLFRLLRGAGVRGLGAMAAQRPLGRGQLLRPLLGVSRRELEAHARQHRLTWVEDPSNRDLGFSRNFLRHRVLPLLAERWPGTEQSLARAAAHLRECQTLLDELARQDLAAALGPAEPAWLPLPSLALAPLLALSAARQRNALRCWLADRTALPDLDHWAGWLDLRDARPDAAPRWRLGAGELQRAGGRIWWLDGAWGRPPPQVAVDWHAAQAQLSLADNGRVSLARRPQGALQVRYRQGGERLELPGRGHRDLKRLLHEHAVPAFVRPRLPLLFRGAELLAVANLPGLESVLVRGCGFRWQPPGGDPV